MSIRHRLKYTAAYLSMGPLEAYACLTGVYRYAPRATGVSVVNAPAPVDRPVVAFGDSITEGKGARPGHGYTGQLAKRLGLQVVNRGIGGATARTGVERLESEVLALGPGLVIIGFGGNDMMLGRPAAEVFEDIEQIVRRVQSAGAVAVVLGIRGSWLLGIDYAAPFRDLAVRTGAALVPLVLDGVWGYPWLMADAAHPNARGYRIIAERVRQVVEPLIAWQTGPTPPDRAGVPPAD